MYPAHFYSRSLVRSSARALASGTIVLILIVVGLGASDVGAADFACDYDPRAQIGTIQANQSPYLNEASGLVQSRRQPDVFWSHQDNSNDERIFAVHRDGTYLGTWDLAVGNARDPEDIAIGPGPLPGVDYIYFGDVGYNNGVWGCTTPNSNTGDCSGCPGSNCQQRDLRVWRAVEPDVEPNQSFLTVSNYPADTITLKFPDAQMLGQRQDVEAMMVDPQSGDLYIVTKRSTPGMVFRAAYPQSTTAPITMEWVADLPFGGDNQATGGDISADGRMILIRRYGDGFIWERADGTSVADALAGNHCHRSGLGETQGEAVALDVSSSGTFYTTSEGGGAVPIYVYRMSNDGCSVAADCADDDFCNGDELCGAGGICESGLPPACPVQVCSETLDQCVDCTSNGDCDEGEVCNSDSGQCEPLILAQPLPIETNDTWRYRLGTTEPSTGWPSIQFDDLSWATGPGGFGYGSDCSSQHGTSLSEMSGTSTSVYLRKPFIVDDPATVGALTLTIDYDDGFVAYLNGQEVARSNVVGSPPGSTQVATQDHECSGGAPDPSPAQDFSINPSLLLPGLNVLALQGHNLSPSSSDFSLIPSLAAADVEPCSVQEVCEDRPRYAPRARLLRLRRAQRERQSR